MANKTQLTLGGSGYVFIGIGTGLAVSAWGNPFIEAAFQGLFWPVTMSYWLMRALHNLSMLSGS